MLLTKHFSAAEIKNDNEVLLRLNSTAIYESKEIVDQYKILFNQLITMGFKTRIINNCFRLNRFTILSQAIDLLLKHKDKYIHRYIEKEDLPQKICDLCEEPIENHIEYIDKNALDRAQSSINLSMKRIQSRFITNTELVKRSTTENSESHICNHNIILSLSEPLRQVTILSEKSIYQMECKICLEEFDYANLTEKYKLECGHTYCQSCLEYLIETEITNGRVEKITCPYKNCTFELIEAHLRVLLDKKEELFTKYLKFRRIKKLDNNPNIIYCHYPNCESYVMYENHETSVACMVKCEFEHEICTRCGSQWHGEKKCEMQLDDEIQKQVLDNKMHLKRCPGCSNWTEKNLGCNHITCVFCTFQWCWLCNQKYTKTHFYTPGTKCYGKQFPQNNGELYEWENYDPVAYEFAKLHANDPEPEDPNPVILLDIPIVPIIPIVPRVMSTSNYFEELSGGYFNIRPDTCLQSFRNVFFDFFIFLFVSLFNFAGNLFLIVYFVKNNIYMQANNIFRNRGSNILLYYLTMLILWSIYFTTMLGSTIVVFGINMGNSIGQNFKRYCRGYRRIEQEVEVAAGEVNAGNQVDVLVVDQVDVPVIDQVDVPVVNQDNLIYDQVNLPVVDRELDLVEPEEPQAV